TLYNGGQTLLQWQRSIAEFLGNKFPSTFGPLAAARRELLAEILDRRMVDNYNRRVDEAEQAASADDSEDAKYARAARLAALKPVPIGEVGTPGPSRSARMQRKLLKRGLALAWVANYAGIKLFAKMDSYGPKGRQILQDEIMATVDRLVGAIGNTADTFMDAISQWSQTPNVTPVLEDLIYGASYGLAIYGATKIIRSRRAIDSEVTAAEIEDDVEYAQDPHTLIREHLMGGTPLGTFYRLFGKDEGGLPGAIRSRQVRDAIRTGYAEGRYDDGDLEILQVDQFGEDVYVSPEETETPAVIYPEMEFVEARRTVGGKWRVAHKTTGDNLIPGESFPSAQAARKAYKKLLDEFKADQERGQTLPAVTRAEQAMLAFDKQGTPLPPSSPIPLEKFQRRARALFDQGKISRASYSAILRYVAAKPPVETRAEAAAA
ncbi:MAG: hypothetical protein ACK5XN_07665, partial [Bacteroidota bacterium]